MCKMYRRYLLLITFLILIISGCGHNSISETNCYEYVDKEEARLMPPENPEKITVTGHPTPGLFSYTDIDKMNSISEYLKSLELSPTDLDPSQYEGGCWVIEYILEGETICSSHSGNMFFQTPDKKWWTIPYEQASAFDSLIRSMIPEELPIEIPYEEWKTDQVAAEPIGLTMNAYKGNSVGVTLEFTQSGGNVTGVLQTGTFLELEKLNENGEWEKQEYIKDNEWDDRVFSINTSGSTQLPTFWFSMYGNMPDGNYRILKRVRDVRSEDDYDEYELYAQFTIHDRLVLDALEEMGVIPSTDN